MDDEIRTEIIYLNFFDPQEMGETTEATENGDTFDSIDGFVQLNEFLPLVTDQEIFDSFDSSEPILLSEVDSRNFFIFTNHPELYDYGRDLPGPVLTDGTHSVELNRNCSNISAASVKMSPQSIHSCIKFVKAD